LVKLLIYARILRYAFAYLYCTLLYMTPVIERVILRCLMFLFDHKITQRSNRIACTKNVENRNTMIKMCS